MEFAGPGLASLPPELLAAICTFLCAHCEREHDNAQVDRPSPGDVQTGVQLPAHRLGSRSHSANLQSVSRVCRSLHAAAQPVLYHCPATSGQPDLWLLVKTLFKRPDLAAWVLQVDIGYTAIDVPEYRSPRDDRRARSFQTFEAIVDALDQPREVVGSLVDAAEHAVLTAMLLKLVPSLQRAHLALPGDNAFYTLLAEFTRSHPHLLSLKALDFSVLDTIFRRTGLSGAVPVLRLAPNLSALHLNSCATVTRDLGVVLGRDANTQPPSLNITELSLSDASLDFHCLRVLLSEVGPGLTKVRLQRTGILTGTRDWVHHLKFNHVLTELDGWKDSLKELSFTSTNEALLSPGRPDLDISRLHGFQVLETLTTDAVFFESHGKTRPDNNAFISTIPSSLQELRLGGYYANLGPDLRILLAAFQVGHYAALRKIEIDAGVAEEYDPESEHAQKLREVAASFQSEGVDFVVHGDEPKQL